MFAFGPEQDPLAFPIGIYPPPYLSKTGKAIRPLSALRGRNTLVLHVFGQSNSANMSDSVQVPTHASRIHNLDVTSGILYSGSDPWLGATGSGGNWFGRLADALIDAGICDDVVWLTYGVGGTPLSIWSSGDFWYRIATASRRAKILGLTTSAYLWIQGESDAADGTSQADYLSGLQNMIGRVRGLGYTAPWFIAKSTYYLRDGAAFTGPDVRSACDDVVDANSQIFAGADTDDCVHPTYRRDEGGAWIHLNDLGCTVASIRWKAIIESVASQLPRTMLPS